MNLNDNFTNQQQQIYIFPLINKTSSYIVYHHKSVNMLYPMLVHNCYINPSLYRVTLAAGIYVALRLSGHKELGYGTGK